MKKMAHQFPPPRNYTVEKVDKSREIVNEKVDESITSTKKKIHIVDKTEKSQKSSESVVTSKNKKMTQFIKQINQGLFQ